MPRLTDKEVLPRYPKPKSYDEREMERKLRALRRKPRRVAEKIALWEATYIVILVAIYLLTSRLVSGSLSSTGGVLFGVSFYMLAMFVAFGVSYYFYSLINSLLIKALKAPGILRLMIGVIAAASGISLVALIRYHHGTVSMIAGVILLNALITLLIARVAVKRDALM